MAISIRMETIARGYKTYFITVRDLVAQLRRANLEGNLEKKLRVFNKSFEEWGEVVGDSMLTTAM